MSDDNCEPDARALAAWQAGDTTTAIQTLHQLYGARLRQQIAVRLDRRLASRVDPEDVLQEAFLDVMAKLGNYQKERNVPLFHWLRMIVQERIIATHRVHLVAEIRDVRREEIGGAGSVDSVLTLADLLLNNDTSASGKFFREERHKKLSQALEEIAPADREIILLRVYENFSNEEAAISLSIEPAAASKRFVRAMQRLSAILKAFPEFKSP